ncbi:MAG: hypothetical protein DI526_01400 [Caulobacter segnis]|uniref:Uncharacterized protein n=1 Tax=Caulobacter segnis TaxID=88688 RepID=A0A2W5VBP7_9CAUL|nr:MAG: hypothetical protein DI526_01400 [Caulobacter segnis]
MSVWEGIKWGGVALSFLMAAAALLKGLIWLVTWSRETWIWQIQLAIAEIKPPPPKAQVWLVFTAMFILALAHCALLGAMVLEIRHLPVSWSNTLNDTRQGLSVCPVTTKSQPTSGEPASIGVKAT